MTGLNSVGSNVATDAAKTLMTATKRDMTAATEALKTVGTNQLNPNVGPETQQTGVGTCTNCHG
jgi:hypothetical protein